MTTAPTAPVAAPEPTAQGDPDLGRPLRPVPRSRAQRRGHVAPTLPLRPVGRVVPVSVVVPTLNEAASIGHVLRAMPPVAEVLVVDGGSGDGTRARALAAAPLTRVLRQSAGGKGTAMRIGFAASRSPYVVAIDGDGSMDPAEIPSMVALLERGFDVVKGSRRASGGRSEDLTPTRRAGNRALLAAHNAMFGARLTDLCYGLIGLRRDRLDALSLYADGFEIEAQILCHAALAGLQVAEVPSTESRRLAGESHLRTCRDGGRVLLAMLRARWQPGRELWRGGSCPRVEAVPDVVA